jgi:hypothetical protein
MPRPDLKVVPLPQSAPEIQVEGLEEALTDLLPLLVRYHKELAVEGTPDLDPDWPALLRAAAFGGVLLVTARHEGALVGFALNVLYAHVMHRSVAHAQTHEWLDPAYRIGAFGLSFLRENLSLLRGKGVKRAYIATPNERVGKVYERAGYAFAEAAYVVTL